MDKKQQNEIIYNFIENELQNNTHPIYADISRRLFEEFNIDIYPAKVAKICKEIAMRKGLPTIFARQRKYINAKQRELQELYKEADAYGITDEEVYLCRTRGYSYSLMCRIYFEITGKTLDINYFSNKYINYCKKHGIKYERNIPTKNFLEKFNSMSKDEFESHSKFFKRVYLEERTRNSSNQRQKTSIAANDPYKVLHNEMNGITNKTILDHEDR